MEALKHAKKSSPDGRWWIKADGCDVRKGLRESIRGTWSGDEDLGDGSLQALCNECKARYQSINLCCLTDRSFIRINKIIIIIHGNCFIFTNLLLEILFLITIRPLWVLTIFCQFYRQMASATPIQPTAPTENKRKSYTDAVLLLFFLNWFDTYPVTS